MFRERIEAWANGPVIPVLYKRHQGQFYVSNVGGEPEKLKEFQRETVDAVLKTYGDKSSQWLSELSHREKPWLDARQRGNLSPGERGDSEIKQDEMAEYYGGLCGGQTQQTV